MKDYSDGSDKRNKKKFNKWLTSGQKEKIGQPLAKRIRHQVVAKFGGILIPGTMQTDMHDSFGFEENLCEIHEQGIYMYGVAV